MTLARFSVKTSAPSPRLWIFGMLLFPILLSAQAPPLINYQGLLTDPGSGDPVPDTDYAIVFAIYDTPTGGAAVWTETQTVQTRGGLFSALLGATTPLTAAVLAGPEKYLGLKVGSDAEMTPRRRIVSGAYAIRSGDADKWAGLDTTDFSASDGNPPNEGSNLVSWDNLTDVPAGFADGIDEVGGGGGGNTLDQAYDQNGPGAGRTIVADAGAVDIQGTAGLTVQGDVRAQSRLGVGIDPIVELHVNGSAKFEGSAETVTIDGMVGIGTNAPTTELHVVGAGQFVGQNSKLTVDGRVGIGIDDPIVSLHVKGSSKFEGFGETVTIDGKVGISLGAGQPLPRVALHVGGLDGVLFEGNVFSGAIPVETMGTRMMWYPGKAAFRAGHVDGGQWDDVDTGLYSVAMGHDTQASGDEAFAVGNGNIAVGQSSVAMGENTIARGQASTAIGNLTTADGQASTAIGFRTIAGGAYSFAGGRHAAVSPSHPGTFIWGDGFNTVAATNFNSEAANEFAVRATGGVRFVTGVTGSGTAIAGVKLVSNGSSWESISDSTKKENFKPLDGEAILHHIRAFRLGTWNYKGQDPAQYRHYGPMAQDFFAAFGQDGIGKVGSDTTIACADFHGVNFTAIHALEKRTAELSNCVAELEKANALLQAGNNRLQEQIADFIIAVSALSEQVAAVEEKFAQAQRSVKMTTVAHVTR